ncbi:hypothetical protein BKA70DRAFT_1440295 [Coprinopsis sp. MPI-PUGE-AT-0042]|nr:hypothetical protein BKA70DRAFT_1440295 [Coprinopsis sp. MPI-PUGE-AT-0042]
MSQVGGGVTTRSSSRKAARDPDEDPSPPPPSSKKQRSTARSQRVGASSVSGRLPPLPQPIFTGLGIPPKTPTSGFDNEDDFFGPSIDSLSLGQGPSDCLQNSPAQAPLSPSSSLQGSFLTVSGNLPPVSESVREGQSHKKAASNSDHRQEHHPPPSFRQAGAHPLQAIPEHPLLFSTPSFATTIPNDFDVAAAQAPADDEALGSRCNLSIDGDDEDFDASPSRQRAGRIPNDHKEVIDAGNQEIDAIFSRMQEEMGRTSENLLNHYLASKGFKRVGRSVWNQYQKYFSAFRVQERVACGNPSATCSEAFTHFQIRYTNWKQILSQVDELIAQKDACITGYRRRTAFNQINQKLETLARINHQTHGFQTFTIIMGNQPNADQNLFSIIESPGAQGFMGEQEDDRPCAMYTSDFMGSFRAHINSLANKAHVADFRSQKNTGALPEVVDVLLNPTRKEQQIEHKQRMVAVPQAKPAKARSTSVSSNISTSDNDTTLRNIIRDFFHTRLKVVKVAISASSFPWKQLDKMLVTQGGVILNYPNDDPFPNLSSDPTYTSPPCKPEGRNGTGIRKIGIPAMRRLAEHCHDGEDGIRFIGGYSKSLIEKSHVPWIVGPIPRDATSTVRCLYYDGSAKNVPRQLLPAEWLSTIKHESLPTPKPSNEPTILHHASSPTRSRSSTPTPQGATQAPTQLINSQMSPLESRVSHLPSPTPQPPKEPALAPPGVNHSTCPPNSVAQFANLHSYPRARIASTRPTPLATIEQVSATSQEAPHASSANRLATPEGFDTGLKVLPMAPSTPGSINIPSSKRGLEESGSSPPSSKRLKSRSPNLSQAVAGPPAQPVPHATVNSLPSPEPSLPRESQPSLPVETPTSIQPALIALNESGEVTNCHKGLQSDSTAARVEPPAVPAEVLQTIPDRSSMQPPPMYQGSYGPAPWQPGYGGYPAYGHLSYYPPPQWGYPDSRSNFYRHESPQDGATTSAPSTAQSHAPNVYPFQPPDAVQGASNRPLHPPPSFYGRPDGPAYPPPFNPRFGSVPPVGFEQYGHMPPSFPPPTGIQPSPGHSNLPPSSG